MNFEITGRPDYAMVEVALEAGENVQAEAGAMVAMSEAMKIQTKAKGGLLGGLKRMVVGETFFTNTFTAEGDAGTIKLAPAVPGDVEHIQLSGQPWLLQSGAYVAHAGEIDVDMKWGGLKTFFAGEGFFMAKVSGSGDLWFSSYGGLTKVDFTNGYVVDTTHIVAFPEGTSYDVQGVGGLKATFLSGEGLVCRFNGSGTVYVQSRSGPPFAAWLNPFRRVEKTNK
jgi:uncharacterized protein (TIGR00266 family)